MHMKDILLIAGKMTATVENLLQASSKNKYLLPELIAKSLKSYQETAEESKSQMIPLKDVQKQNYRKYFVPRESSSVSLKKKPTKSFTSATKLSKSYSKMNKKTPYENIFPGNVLRYVSSTNNNPSTINQNQNSATKTIMEITTVVGIIRERNKRKAKKVNELNNILKPRTKRSLHEERLSNSTNKQDKNHDSPTEKHDPHSKNYEEVQSVKIDKYGDYSKPIIESTSQKPGNVFYKQIWDIINDTNRKLLNAAPKLEPKKMSYIPVFKNCNETTDSMKFSGVDNSTPHSADTNLKEYDAENDRKYDRVFKESEENMDDDEDSNEDYEDVTEDVPSTQNYSVASTDIEERRNDKIYINLQDLQKYKGYTASDAPDYNPDDIPYVEVPDYSDVREESLDEEDRRVNQKKDVEYVDIDVDPKTSTKSKEPSKAQEDQILKSREIVEENDAKQSEEIPVSNPIKENNDKTNQFEKVLNTSDLNRTIINEDASEEVLNDDEDGNPEKISENVQIKEKEVEFEPINFDINEYRKPFDLDEFLNNDPIFKRLDLIKKEAKEEDEDKEAQGETETNDSENDEKNNSSDEEDHFLEDQSNIKISSTSDSPNISSDEIHNEDEDGKGKKKKNIKREEVKVISNENNDNVEDFLKSILVKDDKEESSDRFDGEREFLTKYFTDEIIKKFEDDESGNNNHEDRQANNKEEVYKTLTTILNKKDRISRLEDNVEDNVKDDGKPPAEYKNFWALQYSFPRKEVHVNTSEEEEEEEVKVEKEEEKEEEEE